MLRRGIVVLVAMAMVGSPGVARSKPAVMDEWLPVSEQAKLYADAFSIDAPPAGQTPQSRADWLLNQRPTLGRTPMQWVDWAKTNFTPGAPAKPATLTSTASLATSVLKIYRLVGLTPSPADVRAVTASAARLSPNVQGAFGELVSTVAAAYAAQVPTAKAVAERLAGGFDPTKTLLTIAERDAMNARQVKIADAIDTFRATTAGLLPATTQASTPIFSDPEGLVVLGSTGDDVYTRSGTIPDPVLLIDPSGNDDYLNSAGGACPVTGPFISNMLACNSLVLSVVADVGQGETPRVWTNGKLYNDVYLYDGVPAAIQGAGGPGGIGMLIDVAGDDRYDAKMTRTASEPTQYFDAGAQGYGFGGAGLLADGLGNDWYTMIENSPRGHSQAEFGQGFGGGGGTGVVLDVNGNDWWGTKVYGGTELRGFSGVYTMGTGFYGGIGLLADIGQGTDKYIGLADAGSVDYYAQGFGAFGGTGILYEDGGNDSYSAVEIARHPSPVIDPLLNCAFGTASIAGVGIMVEVAGDDVSYGRSTSTRSSFVMDWGWGGPLPSYGLYIDTGGNDEYTLVAEAGPGYSGRIAGWGLLEPEWGLEGNTFGTFVDIGGNDKYVGAEPDVGNNKVWAFGVDASA